MNPSSPHTDPAKEHSSPPTGHRGIRRSSYFWLMKLRNFLETIKKVPWFSLLLLLLFGWGAYQVVTRPHSSAYAWFRQSMERFEKGVRTVLSVNSNKTRGLRSTQISEPESPWSMPPARDFSDYHTRLTELEKHLETMQAALDQLQQTHHTLQKDLDSINPRVEDIHQTLSAQAQQLAELTAKSASSSRSSELPDSPGEDYSVHAVIQGRAWLNTQDGRMITVNVGSPLPPFGTVQQIDVENRLVYFDQGHIIGPSPHDS